MDIELRDPIYCEVQGGLAAIIKPDLSFTAVFYRQGFYRKERVEYQKSIMIKRPNGVYLFPTGLLPKVIGICKAKNVPVRVIGNQEPIDYGEVRLNTIRLREEQERLVKAALTKQRGVLLAPTGAGKTVLGIAVISAFIQDKDFKVIWLCHTRDLMYQSAKVCKEELGISPGIIGDSSCETDRQITMATRQSYIKHKDELSSYYDMVLIDEAHHITNFEGQYGTILNWMPAPIRIGLTATLPTQNKEAMLAIEGMLGPVLDEVTTQEGAERGIIADIKIKILKAPFSQQVKDLRKYQDVYRYGVVWGKERNRLIIEKAKEHVDKGDSVLILVTQIEHGRNLFTECVLQGVTADFAEGATSAKDRTELKDALNSKRIRCVIATTIWKEGINIPELNVIINAAGGKSEIATIQAIGRGLRRTSTKKEITVYDIFDESHAYLLNHFGMRMSIYTEMGWL